MRYISYFLRAVEHDTDSLQVYSSTLLCKIHSIHTTQFVPKARCLKITEKVI